ncbi:MAG: tetrahydromethanopterin S-methyltransferase subunit A [Candidatus Thorarchaeota archaeon]|jgi:tetrahydromethanopterin S-methyltransferase subunit A
MNKTNNSRPWPPVPGDFEVRNPLSCVAICTLGKKLHIEADYSIIGTCKTENIGIERVIINVISNPRIRFVILAGPEVPGHKTGSSFSSLYKNGVDEETRKIVDAPGAIPYIENVPLDGVERFRSQIQFVDMMNVSNPDRIASKVDELLTQNPGEYPAEPFWVDFKVKRRDARRERFTGSVALLPEYGTYIDPSSSFVAKQELDATITMNPSIIGVRVLTNHKGTILVGREL